MHKRLDLQKTAERRRRRTDTTLLNMMRFIEQEGHEKAEEIDAKTEEEFNIEKGKIVQSARIIIMKQYDKLETLCEKNVLLNNSAMQSQSIQLILRTKQDHLNQIRNDVEKKIMSDLSCSKRRWHILELLMMEGLFKLLETKVKIQCREIDSNTISKYIPLIESQYRLHAKKQISLTLHEKFLPEGSLPGVILISSNGRVSLNNTLESRVAQIIEFCTPLMSTLFYGTSRMKTSTSNRKY